MKNKNLLDSFNNAVNGIVYTIKNERNMTFHIISAIVVLIAGFFFNLSRIEFLIVCLAIALVIICELFNTAVEGIVDVIVHVYHPKAKMIKDVAAGAVLVSAFVSMIVGYFIFFDKLSLGIEMGIHKIRQSEMYLTITALLITIILVLVIKAFLKKGTPFKGGMPSGHAAVAFSITTAISLWTDNARISVLCLIISLLVIQSRLQAKIHSLFELSAGSILGFLVTALMFQIFNK
jgi:diacylglycerol kinase (ATP)